MSKFHEEHLQKVLAFASYGAVSAPPMRGYVVMAIPAQEQPFTIEVFPIVGVIVRQIVEEPNVHRSVTIVPVYLQHCIAHEPNGGLAILEHDDHCNFYYSVVWCDWPEREDHKHLESVRNHVTKEAEYEIKRRQSGK